MSVSTISSEQEIGRDEILSHLRQILADRRFASAERNAGFLRYVVEATLDGRAGEIKETVIANDVYGRSTDYDPRADSIVRVEASRLRQKLRSFYENEGRTSPIRFHLPSGSYVPSFERIAEHPSNPVEPIVEALELPEVESVTSEVQHPLPRPAFHGRLALVAGLSVLAVVLAVLTANRLGSTDSQESEAIAAFQEGTTLLLQDPHSSATTNGPPKTLIRAIERLELAVAHNPKLAPAWATLAEAYDYASSYVGRDPSEDARRSEAAARRAIALDDKLPAGHHMLALVLKGSRWDFKQAESVYKRTLALDPRNAYAVVEYADLLWEMGRVHEAGEEIRKARALLPALPVLAVKEAEIQLHQNRPDAARATAASAIELNRTYFRAHVALGLADEMKGQLGPALALYEHVLKANPNDRRALPAYGYLLARMGQTERARQVASQLEHMNANLRNCAVQVAVVYAGLGEEKLALDWLETAWRTRQAHFPFAAVEYRFRDLHANMRFRELLSRVGLQPIA